MSSRECWREDLAQAEEICRDALREPALQSLARQVPQRFTHAEACYAALQQVTSCPTSTELLLEQTRNIEAEPWAVGRWLLLNAALCALPKVAAYPVDAQVKRLWAEEAVSWARPSSFADFPIKSTRFREMARLATLRRFPAGQFHWEISGLPRSYLLRTELRRWPRLVAAVFGDMRGFSPVIETHINERRKNRLTLNESEAERSYLLAAKSLEKQPHIKGLFSESWLYCESTARVSPRLAWMREFLEQRGALLAATRLATEESGFMRGSEERRRLYESGVYRPTITFALWPRSAMLAWASQYQAGRQAAMAQAAG